MKTTKVKKPKRVRAVPADELKKYGIPRNVPLFILDELEKLKPPVTMRQYQALLRKHGLLLK